jgi:hypothetical protein
MHLHPGFFPSGMIPVVGICLFFLYVLIFVNVCLVGSGNMTHISIFLTRINSLGTHNLLEHITTTLHLQSRLFDALQRAGPS